MQSALSHCAPGWEAILVGAGDLGKIEGVLEDEVAEVYPARDLIFHAFSHFPPEDTRVVILGMDPYINPGQAMGMSFSVPSGTKLPPSLKNIFKEISRDMGTPLRTNGDLSDWANQGVLLMNSYLTVRAGKTGSHKKHWRGYGSKVIEGLLEVAPRLVFLLWGNDAQEVLEGIPLGETQVVLKTTHPSPLSASRGFLGSCHFSLCNRALEEMGLEPIVWG